MNHWTIVSLAFAFVVSMPGSGLAQISDSAKSEKTDVSKRTLPNSGDTANSETTPTPEAEYVPLDQVAAKAFGPPPNGKSLSKRNLWIDSKAKRVYADGYIAMNQGPLEMFACPAGTKEHESIVATLARSSEVHAALLAIGTQAGTTVRFLPRYVPATGQRVRVWICYRDKENKFQVIDGRSWVGKTGTDEALDVDWVFAGSGFWKDPSDNREYYRADAGDMICVSNFSTAMLDVPVASSAEASELQYSPITAKIPSRGTPVRMVLIPIPLPTDENKGNIPEVEKPTEDVLPKSGA